MLIERTNNNQIQISVSSSVDSFGLQRVIDYVKYLEATSKSKAKQFIVGTEIGLIQKAQLLNPGKEIHPIYKHKKKGQ